MVSMAEIVAEVMGKIMADYMAEVMGKIMADYDRHYG